MDSVRKEKDKERAKIWYQQNKEKRKQQYHQDKTQKQEYYQQNKEKILEQLKDYYQENKNQIRNNQTLYYQENKETLRKKSQEWYQQNKGKIFQYNKSKLKNPINNLQHRMRCVIGQCVKRIKNNNKSKNTLQIIGLESWDLFREHIEKQWECGMSWDNHGKGKNNTTWHIDHITPISSATTEEEVYKLNHYTNLRPMWGSDNIRKSNKE
jgi:hypothetical protein